jgi:hypothetical protein
LYLTTRNLLVACMLILFAGPAALDAQVTTATIYGEVHDASGAVVPRANVNAVNKGTGVARDTTTDDRGEFALTALPTGQYTVTIEATGLQEIHQPGSGTPRRTDGEPNLCARSGTTVR